MAEVKPERRSEPPAPAPGPSEIPRYSYGWLLYVLGALLAIALSIAVYKLHYGFGQAPHRIVKIYIGVAVVMIAFFRPKFALHAWLLAVPLGEILPVTGIPGVNAVGLLLLTLVASWVVPRALRRQPIFRPTRLTWPIAAYLGVLLLALVKAATFPVSGAPYSAIAVLRGFWRILPAFAIYYVAVNTIADRRQITNLLVTFGLGCTVGGLLTLRRFAMTEVGRRVAGPLGAANDTGAYFAVCGAALIAFALAPRAFPIAKRIWTWICAAAASVAVLLPKSRGAYVGFAASLGLLTWITSKTAFVVLLAALALSPLWAPDFVIERVAETTVDSIEAGLVGDITDRLDPAAAVRLDIWAVALKGFTTSPIIGHGFASVPRLSYGVLGKPFSAHSLYMETLCDSGLLGIGVLIWLFASCIRSGTELLRISSGPLGRALATAFLAATAAIIVVNVFGQRFGKVAIVGTYVFLAALVERAIQLERDERAEAASKEVPAS